MLDPAEHGVFQGIFGMIFTVLIAVEFNHSLVSVLERRNGVVQVRTVLLIALLAVVRKFIVLEVQDVPPLTLIGLALTTLALGGVYRLVRDHDRRTAAPRETASEERCLAFAQNHRAQEHCHPRFSRDRASSKPGPYAPRP